MLPGLYERIARLQYFEKPLTDIELENLSLTYEQVEGDQKYLQCSYSIDRQY